MRILVVTPIVTHPQNAGNRIRVFSMLKLLQDMGHEVHVVYNGYEHYSQHVHKQEDLRGMRREWDGFYYVPHALSLRIQTLNSKDRSWVSHATFSLLCFFGYFSPRSTRSVYTLDHYVGVIGQTLKRCAPWLFTRLKTHVPDNAFVVHNRAGKSKQSAEETKVWTNDRYSEPLDRFLEEVSRKEHFDVALVEYEFMSHAFRHFDGNTTKVLDTHDVMANRKELHEQQKVSAHTLYSTTRNQERLGLERADIILAIQEQEHSYFEQLINRPVVTVGHITPHTRTTTKVATVGSALYVGTSNDANVHGMRWFIDNVLPRVRTMLPDFQLQVVGNISSALHKREGLHLHGELAALESVYATTQMCINPTFAGTGLKIKCIEALAFGCPLVTTSHAAIGLEDAQGAFLTADTADEMAAAIIEIATKKEVYDTMVRAAKTFSEKNHETVRTALRDVLMHHTEERRGQAANVSGTAIPVDFFTLFTWPRSGASTLSQILKKHQAIRLIEEPFHHKKGKKLRPDDLDTLARVMCELRNTYAGMKHNWGLSAIQNEMLLSEPHHRVLFLWRKNALAREVSHEIAQQTNYWESNAGGRRLIQGQQLSPLNISRMKKRIQRYVYEVSRYRRFLQNNDIPYMELRYEDLYDTGLTHRVRVERLQSIIAFLGFRPFTGQELERMGALLEPSRRKLNTRETYRQVPNIDDVERELGGETIGSLFSNDTI